MARGGDGRVVRRGRHRHDACAERFPKLGDLLRVAARGAARGSDNDHAIVEQIGPCVLRSGFLAASEGMAADEARRAGEPRIKLLDEMLLGTAGIGDESAFWSVLCS